MTDEITPVQREAVLRFRMSCPDERLVLLVIRNEANGAAQTLPMRAIGEGLWEQIVAVRGGHTYRARYYTGDDRRVIYQGPAFVAGASTSSINAREVDGLDAVIRASGTRGNRAVPRDIYGSEEWNDMTARRPWAGPRDQAEGLRLLMARAASSAPPAVAGFR